jgi:hypothetical protein
MPMVFLSYSGKDHFFAELATLKLGEAGISLWRDQGHLRAGKDWRHGIEQGITDSMAIVIALSQHSSESSYVTYEWAYALGKGKPLIPLKLAECTVHPKLETVQYLDFSVPGALPWELLTERIREIETDSEAGTPIVELTFSDTRVTAILDYLNQRGYQMASFERLRHRIDENLTDEQLRELIKSNPGVFRPALLKGNRPGLAKLVP